MDKPISHVSHKIRKRQFILVLIFLFCAVVFARENQVNEDKDKKLREEILRVFESHGEAGLRDFLKNEKEKITNKFIVMFAEEGANRRKKEWIRIAEIMTENRKDEKILADVYLRMGKYYIYISDYKSANDYLEKSFAIYKKFNYLAGQGDVFFCKGEIYLYNGANDNALQMYDKALFFFEKSKSLRGHGSVYFRKGTIYQNIGDMARAEEMYDKALSIFEKVSEPMGQANVLESKGKLYFLVGNNKKSLEMLDKALHLFEKIESLSSQGNIYHFKGYIYFHSGDHKKAVDMYDKALYFFDKIGSAEGQGNVYLSKGGIYFLTGLNSEAVDMYNKALAFYTKVGDAIGQGNVYRSKGEVHLRIGEYSKAQEMYDKALDFSKKGSDLIGQGNVYISKGEIYFATGDYANALDMFEKSSILYKKSGNIRGQGSSYLNIGEIYLLTNNTSKALEMYEKALSFFIKAEYPLGQGNIYKRKGDIYAATGENLKAQKMYDTAMSFFEKIKEPIGLGNIYGSKGDIYHITGNNKKALELYDRALSYFLKAKHIAGQGYVYKRKADIFLKNENSSKALEMFDKALALFIKISDIEPEAICFHGKANTLLKMGKLDEALTLFEKGILKLEKVRKQTAFSEMKKTFMEKVYEQYEETAFFMLENKFYDKGFIYCEAMKCRVFLDRIAEGLLSLNKGLKPELKEKQDKLISKLSILSKEINTTAGKQDEKKLKELKEQYRKVENEFEELLIKIRLENPLYASVQYPEPVSAQDLQQKVLRENELMLRYFIAKDKIYVFLVSKEDFQVVTLKDTAKDVNEIVEQYLLSVEENNPRLMKEYGKILYQKLVNPLETSLQNREEIIIVPDGELATIPFESFVIDDKRSSRPVYLLEKYHIKYIQGASALAILRQHYQRQETSKHFIGFGDPVYDYENFKLGKPEKGSIKILATEDTENTENARVTTHQSPLDHSTTLPLTDSAVDEIKEIHRDRYARAGGIMDRLPASGEEVNAIAALFKKQEYQAFVYEREKATEEKAKSSGLKEFDYIHFSCHGVLGDGFQGLVLSQIPGSTEDGFLTLNEIMNCDYNARLVVLSACRTGKGKMERAEGVTGLTRAVMYAGTPAVIASLWDVDDKATKELMVRFYRYMLEENLSIEEALRLAKLDLIKTKKYASPVHWSAFVMYGE